MKRFLTLLWALLLAFSFVACDNGTASDNTDSTVISQGESTSEGDKTDSAVSDTVSDNLTADVEFTELVGVDNDYCLIKITGIDTDNMWGYTLNVQLENRSADTNYTFAIDSAAINGVRCDPLFATDVAAGKKANEEINFISDDMLKDNGVGDFTDIELTFSVSDADDWMSDDVVKETFHVYPYGKDKAVRFERESLPTDKVLVDNDSFSVTVIGYEVDELWGYTAKMFIENKTDKNLMFSADDVSVNDFMADPLYSDTVAAGNCAFSKMSWSDSVFEENGITDVEEIEFILKVYDNDDLFADTLMEERFTVNP